MKYLRKPFFTGGSIALLPGILWLFFGHMSVFAGDKEANAADAEKCVSATVIVDGCEVSGTFREKSGTIKKVGGNLVLEKWDERTAIEPTEKTELGDIPVTIALRTKQPAGKKTTSNEASSEDCGARQPATAVDSKAE